MKQILVVDDHADIRFMLTELLRINGYSIEEASDGEEALTRIRSGRFDLVITDIHMPGMNGDSLIRNARKELPNLPFVIMTSVVFPELAAEWSRLKPSAIFSKPFKVERLLSTVNDILTAGVERECAVPACIF